jgi:glutathione S-transferase
MSKQQSFQQNNPQGLIPLMELNRQFFAQSLAIIEYLEELHPDP